MRRYSLLFCILFIDKRPFPRIMKNTVKKNIEEMKSLVGSMPKTINEVLDFNSQDDFGAYDVDLPEEEGAPEEEPEKEDTQMDVMAFVDDIRKKSLKGMASLAETPEDERYQLLKKIWQICDKKPEQQTAFGNPNNQAQTAPVQGQNGLVQS